MIKKYKITGTGEICLDFLTPQDQIILSFKEGIIEVDGQKVFYISPSGERRETINWPHILGRDIDAGHLVEIQ